MFDFDKPEDGSEERYRERIRWWTVIDPNKRSMPRARHHFWWLLHNLVAHTAIGLVPIKASFDFHDWTSRKLNGGGDERVFQAGERCFWPETSEYGTVTKVEGDAVWVRFDGELHTPGWVHRSELRHEGEGRT